MDRSWQSDIEHVSLSSAAGVVYHWTVGRVPSVRDANELNEVLDHVAHALSNVASIYYVDSHSMQHLLAPTDLIDARFKRGATVLRNRHGGEYRGLTIRRGDMRAAVNIFKRARISFEKQPQATR
jgi:hypothetical protein